MLQLRGKVLSTVKDVFRQYPSILREDNEDRKQVILEWINSLKKLEIEVSLGDFANMLVADGMLDVFRAMIGKIFLLWNICIFPVQGGQTDTKYWQSLV